MDDSHVTLWDAEAVDFDDSSPDHGLMDPAIRAAWRSLLMTHLPAPPAQVADLGCGTGTLSLLLADEHYRVDGVDFSPGMIERALSKAGHRATVSFTLADATDPPLPDEAYDAVLCRHVLWAIPHPAAALQRWIRLLRPGGRLVLIEGHWSTGAGLTSDQTIALLEVVGLKAQIVGLSHSKYWGRDVEDHRYLAHTVAP